MRTVWNLVGVACLLITLGVTPTSTAQTLPAAGPGRPPGPVAAPSPAQPDGEPFVVEQLITHVRYEVDGRGERRVSARVRILSNVGVQTWGQLTFSYATESESFDFEQLEVLKPNGQTVRPAADAVQRHSGLTVSGVPMFTDVSYVAVTVPSLQPGDILILRTRLGIRVPPARGHFWMAHEFAEGVRILDERLEIDVPSKRAVTVTVRPDAPSAEASSSSGDRRVHVWRSSHVPPVGSAGQSAPVSLSTLAKSPAVLVTTFESWNEVARWYDGLSRDRLTVTPAVKQKAEELTRGLGTDTDRVRALHDFVSQQVRYVSLSFGLGRYAPHQAADVLANLYGDCKDKHALLSAMLSAVGIRSLAVLAASAVEIEPTAPSPGQFDHLFTLVPLGPTPQEWMWVDATQDAAPFGYIPPNIRGKRVLVVDPIGPAGGSNLSASLSLVPETSVVANSLELVLSGEVNALGVLTMRTEHRLRGDREVLLRASLRQLEPAARIEFLTKSVESADRVVRSDFEVRNVETARDPLVIAYRGRQPSVLDWPQQKSSIKTFLPKIQLLAATEGEWQGQSSVLIGGTGQSSMSAEISLPLGYRVRAPVNVSLSRDYGSYESRYEATEARLSVNRTIRLSAETLPAARSADFLAFVAAIRKDEAQSFAVEASSPIPTPSVPQDATDGEIYSAGYAAYQAKRYKDAAVLYRHLVDRSPSHSDAWNGLGLSLWQEKEWRSAADAMRKQIALNPFHKQAHRDLGHILRDAKDDAGALAAYREHLQINPLDGAVLNESGAALQRLGRLSDALADFEKAADLGAASPYRFRTLAIALIAKNEPTAAVRALSRELESSPSAESYAGAALLLAEKSVDLTQARQWAEVALTRATEDMNGLTVQSYEAKDIAKVNTLAWAWNAMGWTLFRLGQTDAARPYLASAWHWGLLPQSADHLGQLSERLNDRLNAAIAYTHSAHAWPNPTPAMREKLQRAAGPAADVDSMIAGNGPVLIQERSVTVTWAGKGQRLAGFVVGLDRDFKVTEARFLRGQDGLRAFGERLVGLRFPPRFAVTAPVPRVTTVLVGCTNETCLVAPAIPWFEMRQPFDTRVP